MATSLFQQEYERSDAKDFVSLDQVLGWVHRHDFVHRQLAQWRQRIAFANAVEQGTTEFRLQRLDAAAQRGLREVRAFRSAAE